MAFKKAIVGGAAGALAWEIAVRVLILLGLPMFDLVRVLGRMVFGPDAGVWQWWPAGMAMHALVGVIWAIFYAYFFWSIYDFPPFLQGLLFSILPALLAGFVMIPQMDFMLDGQASAFRMFAVGIGVLGPVSVVLGHMIYGVVMGAVYVRPVGYAVGRRVEWYG